MKLVAFPTAVAGAPTVAAAMAITWTVDTAAATTTCTQSSMTSPGWRTQRSCPTRRPTCEAFLNRAATYFTAHRILSIERVITDNHFELSTLR